MCKRYKTAYKGAGHLPCPFDKYQNGTITFMKSQWLQMNYYICMWQKCGDMGINGFIFKKSNSNINERKNSWLFRIFLQNSTANPANLHLDWAELAVLLKPVSWQNGYNPPSPPGISGLNSVNGCKFENRLIKSYLIYYNF